MDFNSIYEQYNQVIYRLCLGYTNDAHWAKDIVQDTFISVWKNLEKFREEAQISTWIYRIAVNNCIKQLEKKKKHNDREIFVQTDNQREEHNTQMLLLRKYISVLPEIDRLIISMELEEIPQLEIAEILGISHSNVRVRVHRIKESLTKKFKTEGHV